MKNGLGIGYAAVLVAFFMVSKPAGAQEEGAWNGAYIGLHLGASKTDIDGHSGLVDHTENQLLRESATNDELSSDHPGIDPATIAPSSFSGFLGDFGVADPKAAFAPLITGESDLTNITGGFQGGYNFQFGSFVIGVEGSASFARFEEQKNLNYTLSSTADPYGHPVLTPGHGTNSVGANSTDASARTRFNTKIEGDWLASLRGRIGFTPSPWLMTYVTGGVAFTSLQAKYSYTTENDFDDNATHTHSFNTFGGGVHTDTFDDSYVHYNGSGSGSGRAKEKLTGFVIGGGVEALILSNLVFRLEYLHYNFNEKVFFTDAVNGQQVRLGASVNTGQIGLSLKF